MSSYTDGTGPEVQMNVSLPPTEELRRWVKGTRDHLDAGHSCGSSVLEQALSWLEALLLVPWTPGPPVYESPPADRKKDRPVWLVLHDQGGYTFTAMGYLHGEHGPDFDAERSAYIEWLRNERNGPPPKVTLIPHLSVPQLRTDGPLSGWWNIEQHAEIILPEHP